MQYVWQAHRYPEGPSPQDRVHRGHRPPHPGGLARLLSGTFLTPILIGNEAEIFAAAEEAGFNIRGATIIDPETYEDMEAMVTRMVELRKGKMTADECRAMLKKATTSAPCWWPWG